MSLDEETINTEEPIEEAPVVDAGKDESASVADEHAEDDDAVVVTLGDEPPPQVEEEKAPEWVRQLRKSSREKDRKIKELEQKLHQAHPENNPALTLGPKPKMEDSDIDFDEDAYSTKLADWLERKRKIEAEESKAKAEAERAEKDWQDKLNGYETSKVKAKTDMKLEDFDEAEAEAMELFSTTQKGIILHGSKNPAILLYALGKDAKTAQEFANIKDPIEFAWSLGAKEAKDLKVTKRTSTTPAPERKINGSAPVTGGVDQTLERLRAEADRTNDFTKVNEYKRQKRQR